MDIGRDIAYLILLVSKKAKRIFWSTDERRFSESPESKIRF